MINSLGHLFFSLFILVTIQEKGRAGIISYCHFILWLRNSNSESSGDLPRIPQPRSGGVRTPSVLLTRRLLRKKNFSREYNCQLSALQNGLPFPSSTGQCFLTRSLLTNEPGTLPAFTTHSVTMTHSLYFQLPEKIFLPTSLVLVTSASIENNELGRFVYREQNFRS